MNKPKKPKKIPTIWNQKKNGTKIQGGRKGWKKMENTFLPVFRPFWGGRKKIFCWKFALALFFVFLKNTNESSNFFYLEILKKILKFYVFMLTAFDPLEKQPQNHTFAFTSAPCAIIAWTSFIAENFCFFFVHFLSNFTRIYFHLVFSKF